MMDVDRGLVTLLFLFIYMYTITRLDAAYTSTTYNKNLRDGTYHKNVRDATYNKNTRDATYNKNLRDGVYNKNVHDGIYSKNLREEYPPHPKEQHCGCFMGPAGTAGVPGVPGLHGERGTDGRTGAKGDLGLKGEIGWKGSPGHIGLEGPAGKRGRKGVLGEAGTAGNTGSKGLKGERGYPGMHGDKGTKGDAVTGSTHKIAFSVVRQQRLGPVIEDTPISFDTVMTNLNEAFDTYTSHFVCKLNGTYVFMVHILGQNNKDVYAWIMHNDKHTVPLHGDKRAGYGTGSQTIILRLKTEDHVWIQLSKNSGLLNDYTTFSGYILYED